MPCSRGRQPDRLTRSPPSASSPPPASRAAPAPRGGRGRPRSPRISPGRAPPAWATSAPSSPATRVTARTTSWGWIPSSRSSRITVARTARWRPASAPRARRRPSSRPGLRGRTGHPLPRPAGPPRAADDVAGGRRRVVRPMISVSTLPPRQPSAGAYATSRRSSGPSDRRARRPRRARTPARRWRRVCPPWPTSRRRGSSTGEGPCECRTDVLAATAAAETGQARLSPGRWIGPGVRLWMARDGRPASEGRSAKSRLAVVVRPGRL